MTPALAALPLGKACRSTCSRKSLQQAPHPGRPAARRSRPVVRLGCVGGLWHDGIVIELKPEHEQIIEEAVRQGRFPSAEEALDQALRSIAPLKAPKQGKRQPGKGSLVELFAPLRELDLSDLDFSRNPSTGRPVDFG